MGRTAALMQTALTNLLILSATTVAGVLTARELGPEAKGVQAALVLLPSLLTLLAAWGLPTALLYLSRTPRQAAHLWSAALVWGGLAATLFALLGAALVPAPLAGYDPALYQPARFCLLFVPFTALSQLYTALAQATGRYRLYNLLRLAPPCLSLTLLALLMSTQTLTAVTAAAALLAPALPLVLGVSLHVQRTHPLSLTGFWSASQRLLRHGAYVYSADLLGVAAGHLDRIAIVLLLPVHDLGLYTVALSLARLLALIPTAVVAVLTPGLTARPLEEVGTLVGRAARISTWVTLVGAAGLMLTGPPLLRLLYGRDFSDAWAVLWLLSLDAALLAPSSVLALAFYAAGRPSLVVVRQGVGLTVLGVGLWGLTGPLGLLGVAWAVLAASSVTLALTLLAFARLFGGAPPIWSPQEDAAQLAVLWRTLQAVR